MFNLLRALDQFGHSSSCLFKVWPLVRRSVSTTSNHLSDRLNSEALVFSNNHFKSCIDKWLKTQQTCPSCKRQAKRTDLRRLYVKSIKVVDNSELENALRDLEGERRLRKKVEIEFADLKLRYQLVRDELTSEKEKYNSLLDRIQNQQLAQSLIIGADGGASSSCSANSASSDKPAFHYVLEKLLPLTEVLLSLYNYL